ncbi:MAG: phosphatidate cytidylyltransferase [Solirubrobacterales bacterium]|nr:phosphatidate cytidylyltransferase [Solirubrobacterales bacterium]
MLGAAFLAALIARRGSATRGVPAVVLAAAWIGVGLAHGVLLRELTHGGALVLDVLLATFLGDTAAQLGGSAFGRRKLAASISPGKTVEGLGFGIFTGTAVVLIAALGFQDFIDPLDALWLGLACSLAAPCGDLLESMLKREAALKDSGSLLGPHGGMLDRIDACLFSAVAGYYVSIALIV